MRANDFNCKVNLPKLCAGMKMQDLQFVKLPTFGWFAYNKDRSYIANLYELFPPDDSGTLYKHIVKDKPGHLDFPVPYSEVTDQRLRSNLNTLRAYHSCYTMSVIEAEKYQVKINGKRALLKDVLIENGLPNVIGNGVGVVTPLIRERWSMLHWPKNAIGKLLVPTYCTPKHICSLELVDWQTFETTATLFMNDERGWMGKLGNRVVRDLKEVGTSGGNTWDYKCDFWNDTAVGISDILPIGEYIKIWTEARHTVFVKNPLEFIKESGQIPELSNHITNLNYSQIEELEKVTGEQLSGYWKNAREHTIQLGGFTFVKRDNCYYIQKRGGLLQVSNFTLDIDKIVKVGKGFVRKGHIYFRDKVVPCEIENKFFTTHYLFKQGISVKFLEYGIGVPIISPQFEHVILQIINSFSEHAEVTTT